MTDTRAMPRPTSPPADGRRAGRSLWRRLEPAMLGVGSIVVLLLLWEVLPRLFTLSAGTKLFFTTPSQIAGTLWTAVRDRRDLGAARRQRRRASRIGLVLPSSSACRSAC